MTETIALAQERRFRTTGLAFGLGAYLIWGTMPAFWKLLDFAGAVEILAHRALWGAALCISLMAFSGRLGEIRRVLAQRRWILPLVATTAIISLNWVIFIWAVNQGYVLSASLGYYINPLVNVLLALLFLGERLSRWAMVAVGLAAVGVLNLAFSLGVVPWISLSLAFSFGVYGLIRKVIQTDALTGLTVETLMMTPLALLYLLWLEHAGAGAVIEGGPSALALLMLAGPVTAIPLLLFTAAARRLRYVTVGLLQYLAPTGHFLLAILVYDEPFGIAHMVTFACIWGALAIYSMDAYGAARRRAAQKDL